jgi:DNA-directed RNA polymerase subunit M/transcription elongation factor TFIIS
LILLFLRKYIMSITTAIREKMRGNLFRKLAPAAITLEEVASLEEGIYSAATTLTGYSNQGKIVYLHLAPDSNIENSYLLPAIREGTLKFRDVGAMSECDMNPAKWQGVMSKIAEAKQVSHGPQVVPSDIIKCRCGGQTTFTESQTRSCDEAMTIKATCLKCGKRFNI